MSTPEMPHDPPVIPGYRVDRHAGSGGMGDVYDAVDLADDRRVAIKVLRRHTAGDTSLQHEFSVLRGLRHPGLVSVSTVGTTDDGRSFLVMDWIDGEPIAARHFHSGDGTLDARAFADAVVQIADALHFIHARHIVHGDVKPGNILLTPGPDGTRTVTLMDFGLSSAAGDPGDGLSGTVEYMAPELIRGNAPSASSDLYALGCVLYETLSGALPFDGDTAMHILQAHLSAAPAPFAASLQVPPEPARWIDTLLQKEPPFRYRSALHLRRDAAAFLGLEGDTALDVQSLRLPFVARDTERSKAMEVLRAESSRGGILLIEGPAGIGKTTFLQDICTEMTLSGAAVRLLRNRANGAPFETVLQFLRSLPVEDGEELAAARAVVERSFPGTFAGVAPAPDSGLSDDALRLRLFHAAAQLLVRATSVLLLAFDDAHRTDELTRGFLSYFSSYVEVHSDRRFLLVIGTDRTQTPELADEVAGLAAATRIVLQSFTVEQSRDVLRSLLGERVSPSFLSVLIRQSGGAPGHIEELLRFCLREGVLEATADGWIAHERDNLGAFFPASIEDSFVRLLSTCSEEDTRILTALAQSPVPVPLGLLSLVCGMPAEDTFVRCGELSDAGLLREERGQYGPLHAVLANLLHPDDAEVRRLNDLYASWYRERGEDVPAWPLALHLFRSSASADALPHLLRAARERRSAFDAAGAEDVLTKALSLTRGPDHADQRFDILGVLWDTENLLGKRDAEEESLEEMLVLAAQSGVPGKLASVYRSQTEYYISTAEFDRARKSAEKALSYYASAGDRLGEALCHQKIGFAEYRTRPGRNVLVHYREALSMYAEENAFAEEGMLLVDIGLVYYSILDDPATALEHFDRARGIFERIGNERGLIRADGNAGAQLYALGKFAEALERHGRANILARRIGDRRFIATSLGSMGQCELALCSYADALAHLQEELRISREIRDAYLEEMCLENLGELALALGDTEKSVTHYTAARQLAERSGNDVGRIACDIDIAGALIEQRDGDGALRLLKAAKTALETVEDVNVSAVLLYRFGILHLAKGPSQDFDKALEHFRELGDLADRHDFRSYRVLARSYAAFCLLSRGRLSEAQDLSEAAIALLDEGGPLYGGAHDVLLNHAIVLRANKQPIPSIAFIDRAYADLMAAAATISDVHLYRSYLEQVRVNVEIVREYTLAHRSDSKDAIAVVREQNLRTLYDVARKINSVLDLPLLLDNIMDSALDALNGERGLIFLTENDQLVLKVSRNVEKETIQDATEISLSILRDVVSGGHPIIVSDTSKDDAFRNRESVRNFRIHSLICVPMKAKDRLIGTVYVDSRADALKAMSFSDIDAEFLEAFANLATIAIENARLHARLQEENLYLRKEVARVFSFENIVGESAPMLKLFAETQAAIASEGAALISGESGTGKELVAKAIHHNGARRNNRFVAVDCGALPDTLLESELFGYKRGAFTGAYADKPGLFEEANHGTLFLDEISNTSLAFQAKLLRVLQDGEFRRVGDTSTRSVNVRIICATNTLLADEIASGRFRQDLFYRLNVIPITVPPLRNRTGDIPLLVQHFIAKYKEKNPSNVKGATTELHDALRRFPWKGNVRELENLVNRMIAQAAEDVLSTRDLPGDYNPDAQAPQTGSSDMHVSFHAGQRLMSLSQAEREHIQFVLQHAKGNKTEAAKLLGLKRTTLIEKMKKLGIM
ncbi:MAG: sigma 54-interacting transcriptional regulator [Ignavibacteria bacterium]|nr:sigma 54-interacting transcriptional regulator [Ignavibacteria bacterium]